MIKYNHLTTLDLPYLSNQAELIAVAIILYKNNQHIVRWGYWRISYLFSRTNQCGAKCLHSLHSISKHCFTKCCITILYKDFIKKKMYKYVYTKWNIIYHILLIIVNRIHIGVIIQRFHIIYVNKYDTHHWIQFSLLRHPTFSIKDISAPLLRSRLTMSVWPFVAAHISAVFPAF